MAGWPTALRGVRRLATVAHTAAGSAGPGSLLYPMTNLSTLRAGCSLLKPCLRKQTKSSSCSVVAAPSCSSLFSAGQPLRIVAGKGAVVRDDAGKEYLEEPRFRSSFFWGGRLHGSLGV